MNAKLYATAILFIGLACPLKAEETRHFCSMDEAVGQMVSVAGLNAAGMQKDLGARATRKDVDRMINSIAEDQVKRKLFEGHGKELEITWKDIYDVRGTASAWMCNEGQRLYCVSSFIDAIGSGLTGTRLGRGLYTGGLVLAGPAGFVMMSGMEITQKTFQCNPDGLAMALDAGASVVVMLPWCRAPGARDLCVRAQQVAGKTVMSVMGRYMGREFAIGTARLLENEASQEFVKVVVEHGKETVTHAVAHQVHGKLTSHGEVAVEVPSEPLPASMQGVPVGDGLYMDDPSAMFR
jgi:hypothetical protein